MTGYFLALFILVFGSTAFAQPGSAAEGYTAAPGLDLDRSWLDPGEAVEIVSYDAKTGTYEVSKTFDPTILKIYTKPESLAAAVNIINLPVLKENPAAIVGHEYDLDRELVLVDEDEPGPVKKSAATTSLAGISGGPSAHGKSIR